MKFWPLSHNNTDTRWIFNGPPGAASGPSEGINLERLEKEEAIRNTESALAELQSRVETENGVENLSLDEKLDILIRIARNEAIYDDEEDSRGRLAQARDWVGSGLEGVSDISKHIGLGGFEGFTRSAQEATDLSTEAYVISILKDDVVLTRFLSEHQEDSFNLFTDRVGDNTYRTKLFGNKNLEANANFMELLSPAPENRYLEINGTHFVRTPHGYAAFFPKSEVGKRAKIESTTVFKTSSSLTPESPEAESLVNLKKNNPFFRNIESGASVAVLEQRRKFNFHTSQTWKRLADELKESFKDSPTFPEMADTIPESFKVFLDGNFYAKNLITASTQTTANIEVIGITEALFATDEPHIFREKITKAIGLIAKHLKEKIDTLSKKAKEEKDPEKKKELQEQSEQISNNIPKIFGTIQEFITDELENNSAAMNANEKLFSREFPDLPPESINTFLTEFDTEIKDLMESKELTEGEAMHIAGTLFGKILGSNLEGTLEDYPHIKNLVLARINIITKEYGITSLSKSAEVIQQEYEIARDLNDPSSPVSQIAAELGIDPKTELSLEDLEAIAAKLKEKYEAAEKANKEGVGIPTPVITKYLRSYENFLGKVARLRAARREAAEARDEAITVERNTETIIPELENIFDPETPEGKRFHETVDISAEYIREYAAQNNGAIPPDFTSEKFNEISTRLEAGESPESIRLSLGLKSQTSSPESISGQYLSPRAIPAGATNARTLENGNLAFDAGSTTIEVDSTTNPPSMFPHGTEGLQREWMTMPATAKNVLAIQIGGAVMSASVEDGQEGLGLMFRKMGREKFQILLRNLSFPRMGRLLQPKEEEGLQAIKNQFGSIDIIFEKLGLLREDGQAAPENVDARTSEQFFNILTSAAVGNFKSLE